VRPFVDTNVLVYAHDEDEPVKRRQALALLEEVGARMTLSPQVLAEFYVTVTRKLPRPLDAQVAAAQVDALRAAATVTTDADLIIDAIQLSQAHQLSLWDAMILRSAERGGCDTLFSEDLQDGLTLAGVTVRNPFTAASAP
jgi:predicted nucleic acid-binding protein